MWANSVWGFLGCSITFGIAALGLPHEYLWLQSYFTYAAVGSGIASILTFCWPLIRQRSLAAGDRIEGWSVSAKIGNLGALPQDKTIFFQKVRLVNVSSTQPRILDVEIFLKIEDFQIVLRTEDQNKTQYRKKLDELGIGGLDRTMGYIQLPIQLPPNGIVEGQLEFSMSDELVRIFSEPSRWSGKIRADIKLIEHRSGRSVTFRYGRRYDAIRGREVRTEGLLEHLIWKLRVLSNKLKKNWRDVRAL